MSTASSSAGAWRIHNHELVGSTNDLAAQQPGWNVVVAKRQLQGRGRYKRSWVSDEGGIWLSAVLPTPGQPETWAVLPLAAGWALREAIQSLGVTGLRLRWPNDLMLGTAKLAGILVERFNPETAVIGIGINYANSPESENPELAGMTTRLADLLQRLPAREQVLGALLAHLSIAQQRIEAGEVEAFLPALNRAWQIKRVTVTLNSPSRVVTGAFEGVDTQGRLLLALDSGEKLCLPPIEVELLREL